MSVASATTPEISVLLPSYNERENLLELVPEIRRVLDGEGRTWEVLIVDDGSTDGTADVVPEIDDERVRGIRLRRNSGKSAALNAGFDNVRGELIILMDADLQDDPNEIPKLLEAMDGGLDQVTGRRATRNDRFIKRNTSKIYNAATSRVSGVPGKDFNSGFKILRREVIETIEIYGELHRYIPVLAHWSGFKVGEVDVTHHARAHGESKFGRARFWRGFLDLVTVKFLTTYTARPFHLFGGLGVALGMVGGALLLWMLVLRIAGEAVGSRPALLAGVLLTVIAVQFVFFGLLAELMVHLRRGHRDDAGSLIEPIERRSAA